MGHDFIKYNEDGERFNDFDLWTFRHFFLEQARALEKSAPTSDTAMLREFFERWNWLCPGVFTGTDFSAFVRNDRSRWELLFRVFQGAGDRIAEFGEHVPLAYLQAHVNTATAYYTHAQPTNRLLLGIGRVCKFLSKHKPDAA